jgi:hypothetical protein
MSDETSLIQSAIQRRRCVRATYNRGEVVLAPYLLYKRHDELHLAAALVSRDGAAPKIVKVGAYRLSGLAGVEPTTKMFTPKSTLMDEYKHPADEIVASALAR